MPRVRIWRNNKSSWIFIESEFHKMEIHCMDSIENFIIYINFTYQIFGANKRRT